MQNLTESIALLQINLNLAVSPLFFFEGKETKPVSTAAGGKDDPGHFAISVEAALRYDSVSSLLQGYLAGQRFTIAEGILPLHITLNSVKLAGSEGGELFLHAGFSGSFSGTVDVRGTPVYNPDTSTVVLLNPTYSLQTKSLLLKGAKLLFASRIEKELRKVASISISRYLQAVQASLTEMINREWAEGIEGSGFVNELRLDSIKATARHLLLHATSAGDLAVRLSAKVLNIQR